MFIASPITAGEMVQTSVGGKRLGAPHWPRCSEYMRTGYTERTRHDAALPRLGVALRRRRPRPRGTSRGPVVYDRQHGSAAMMIDPRAKLLAVLDHAEEYRGLAIRAKDRGEREIYERIVELYVEIAEELEALIDGRS
jgi:hypothetical protein